MLVYRVEAEDGIGPYQRARDIDDEDRKAELIDVAIRLCGKHSGSYNHPIAHFDCPNFNSEYYCGFASMSDLKRWFHGFITILRRAKFSLCIYESDEVTIGRHQVGFVKETAVLVSKKRI